MTKSNGQLESLARAYPEFEFREFPDAKHSWLRMQAGIRCVESAAAPPNKASGFLGFSGYVERFYLKAFAPDAAALAEKLNGEK